MRIFIWDKVFEINFEEETDIEYNKLSDKQLAQIKELVEKDKTAAKKDYLSIANRPASNLFGNFSDISEEDKKHILAFIKLIETDKRICWPEFRHPDLQEEPEEKISYEGEVWDFIDACSNSTICKFDYSNKPLRISEILAFLQCSELLETIGQNTLRALFTDIIRYDNPSISKQLSCGFLGDLANKSQLVNLLSKL